MKVYKKYETCFDPQNHDAINQILCKLGEDVDINQVRGGVSDHFEGKLMH
jgi:hypothetical protein